jgi:hypothetical protein
MDIRKISVGADYKNNAMHYIVGQPVIGGRYTISAIVQSTEGYHIWITDDSETLLWKFFSAAMPVSVEFNINF